MENTCEHFENCPSQCCGECPAAAGCDGYPDGCGECPVGNQREPEPDVMVGNATSEEYRAKVVEEEPCTGFPLFCEGACPFGKKEKPEKACTLGISRGVKTARDEFGRFQALHILTIVLTSCHQNLKAAAKTAAMACKEEAEMEYVAEAVGCLTASLMEASKRLNEAARPLEIGLLTVERIKESRESVNE